MPECKFLDNKWVNEKNIMLTDGECIECHGKIFAVEDDGYVHFFDSTKHTMKMCYKAPITELNNLNYEAGIHKPVGLFSTMY